MKAEKMEPIKKDHCTPPNTNINPFHYDQYHMGVTLGKNLTAMRANFDDQDAKYIILVDTATGERMKVTL